MSSNASMSRKSVPRFADANPSTALPMSKRIVRVNELLKREISAQLHTHYRTQAVRITITDVETAPDLRRARVFYSVVGDACVHTEADAMLRRIAKDLRHRVGREVILKYLPEFEFCYDPSLERGAGILEVIDEIEQGNE